MFDRLLKQPHALAVHRNGPLAEERRCYLAHCAEQQMSWDSLRCIASYTLVIAKALRLAKRPGELITRAEIEAAADRRVNRRSRRPRRRKNRRLAVRLFTGHAVRWLTFVGRLQPPATVQQPYADQVAQFTDYMLRERGLSPSTIAYSRGTIQEFLAQIDKADLQLKMLTAAKVNELLAQKVRNNQYSRVGIRRWASAMRPFFRFAEGHGWCCRGLADAVKTPPVFRYEGLPLGPSWDDVNRLLAAAQSDCPVDIRDRALLLLLAVYGLRAGEVAALRLDDFDWEREVLTVPHGKRQRPRTYPLCRPVGDAVLRYLRKVRPRSDRREVFMTLLAPFRPLHSNGVAAGFRARPDSLVMAAVGRSVLAGIERAGRRSPGGLVAWLPATTRSDSWRRWCWITGGWSPAGRGPHGRRVMPSMDVMALDARGQPSRQSGVVMDVSLVRPLELILSDYRGTTFALVQHHRSE